MYRHVILSQGHHYHIVKEVAVAEVKTKGHKNKESKKEKKTCHLCKISQVNDQICFFN